MKNITILHYFTDDKFFDSASEFFDSLEGVNNIYCFYTKKKNYCFHHIHYTDKILLINNKQEYYSMFSSPEVDVIYFQSIPVGVYNLFNHIGSDKKVIWWSWGYDIYHQLGFYKAFIPINILKPITKSFLYNTLFRKLRHLATCIYITLRYPFYLLHRQRVLERIDYYTPVLPIEYDLLKQFNPNFKALPFMLHGGPSFYSKIELRYKTVVGNVLVGNSLTYTNNHFDVLEVLKDCTFGQRQKVIFPVNYGGDYRGNISILKDRAQLIHAEQVWLESFLGEEEYFQLFDNVTHAVFGVIRQQAMGNIFNCLRKGIKVFLFKDSVVYQSLKQMGFCIFSIEDDLNGDVLMSPLDFDCVKQNTIAYNSKVACCIKEIQDDFMMLRVSSQKMAIN